MSYEDLQAKAASHGLKLIKTAIGKYVLHDGDPLRPRAKGTADDVSRYLDGLGAPSKVIQLRAEDVVTVPTDFTGEGDLSEHEARALTDRIMTGIESVVQLRADITTAYERRAWVALGFESWDAYVKQNFGLGGFELAREEQRALNKALVAVGATVRDAAAASGTSAKTAARDTTDIVSTDTTPKPGRPRGSKTEKPTEPDDDMPTDAETAEFHAALNVLIAHEMRPAYLAADGKWRVWLGNRDGKAQVVPLADDEWGNAMAALEGLAADDLADDERKAYADRLRDLADFLADDEPSLDGFAHYGGNA